MTWTYTASPATVATDEVHFLVGDTDQTAPLVQDEEIDYYLTLYPKPAGKPAYLAAAAVAEAIAAKFARKMDQTLGSLQASAKQQHDHYVELAQSLRTSYATDGEGLVPSTALRIKPGVPRLGGGGDTALGGPTLLATGGTGA